MLVRVADQSDASELSRLMNLVVDEGDKTAIDTHLTEVELAEWFLTGDHCVSCFVAQNDRANILGFQALERFHADLPDGTADIATFVSSSARAKGVGRALFEATERNAQNCRVTSLRAVVRSSNQSAIRYYRSIGFMSEGDVENSHSVVLTRSLPQ